MLTTGFSEVCEGMEAPVSRGGESRREGGDIVERGLCGVSLIGWITGVSVMTCRLMQYLQ